MLVVSIEVSDIEQAIVQIHRALNVVDLIELRLDFLNDINIDDIKKLKDECVIPVLFTLRRQSQGGVYKYSEDQRLKDIKNICSLHPEFIDLEYDIDPNFLESVYNTYPNIKIISSYHEFKYTPENINDVLNKMRHHCFYAYKIAAFANSTSDTLRMLTFVQANQQIRVCGISMGELGTPSRILGPIVGSYLNYCCLDSPIAPGQLQLQELYSTYHFKQLNSKTKIFALLGDPIQKSIGHRFHNNLFRLQKRNAVYVKLKVSISELEEVIRLCAKLPFAGFSVTMPLKEKILQFISTCESDIAKIKAINTIVFNKETQLHGFNTDGLAVMHVLANYVSSLKNKKIVILGCGGSAKAIAYHAVQQNAQVLILNRSVNKSFEFAKEIGCKSNQLKEIKQLKNIGYDFIINTLPFETMDKEGELLSIIQTEDFLSNTIAMDIVYSERETQFLKLAKEANCICIEGAQMFFQQAIMQNAKFCFLSERD